MRALRRPRSRLSVTRTPAAASGFLTPAKSSTSTVKVKSQTAAKKMTSPIAGIPLPARCRSALRPAFTAGGPYQSPPQPDSQPKPRSRAGSVIGQRPSASLGSRWRARWPAQDGGGRYARLRCGSRLYGAASRPGAGLTGPDRHRLMITTGAKEQRRSAGAGQECPSGPIPRRTCRRRSG